MAWSDDVATGRAKEPSLAGGLEDGPVRVRREPCFI